MSKIILDLSAEDDRQFIQDTFNLSPEAFAALYFNVDEEVHKEVEAFLNGGSEPTPAPAPVPVAPVAEAPRGRGRPRKDATAPTPAATAPAPSTPAPAAANGGAAVDKLGLLRQRMTELGALTSPLDAAAKMREASGAQNASSVAPDKMDGTIAALERLIGEAQAADALK